MKTTAVLLALCFLLAGASCETRPDPPSAVEVRVAVPVPCRVPLPECAAPAFDSATKDAPGDASLRLLRAEVASQADCIRRLLDALEVCRSALPISP